MQEMAAAASFYFADDIEYEDKAARKFLKSAAQKPLCLLVEKLTALAVFEQKALEDVFRAVMDETQLKLG